MKDKPGEICLGRTKRGEKQIEWCISGCQVKKKKSNGTLQGLVAGGIPDLYEYELELETVFVF